LQHVVINTWRLAPSAQVGVVEKPPFDQPLTGDVAYSPLARVDISFCGFLDCPPPPNVLRQHRGTLPRLLQLIYTLVCNGAMGPGAVRGSALTASIPRVFLTSLSPDTAKLGFRRYIPFLFAYVGTACPMRVCTCGRWGAEGHEHVLAVGKVWLHATEMGRCLHRIAM
jgi:hypothetical protein